MNICDSCETVQHCRRHGCIPKQPWPFSNPTSTMQATPQPKSLHQTLYDYVQACHTQEVYENAVATAFVSLGSENAIIDLAQPLKAAYTKHIKQLVTQDLWDWLEWWMYETEYGTRPFKFVVDGTSYDPTTITLFKFLEIVDAGN